MAPMKKSDVTLIFLYYEPSRPIDKINITSTFHTMPPLGRLGFADDWAERIIMGEAAKAKKGIYLTFTEWRVLTSNHSLFNIQGFRFDNILVILGEERVYYMFNQKPPLGRTFTGVTKQFASFCSCCVGHHHMSIMTPIMKIVATKTIT